MEREITLENNQENKLKKFINKLPRFLKDTSSLFYYFLFLCVLGIVFFATTLFINDFTTPFTGDYCAQQFAFYTNGYDDWWYFIKTGEFVLYDTNTFLGANNIGSNSFYYLFDPFFLPILLFPRSAVPQGMAILTIIKMAMSGITFFLYVRYMGASRTSAKITGIAYAFSGWITWYLWFNHFTGVAIVLPLMLLGVEKVLREKNGLILAGSIALMGFVNYFFLVCFALCAFMYAFFRFFQRIKLNSVKDNFIILGIGFGFAIIGVLICSAIVIPSAMVALTSSRAETNSYLTNILDAFKNKEFKEAFGLLTDWSKIDDGSNYEIRNQVRPYYFIMELIFPVTTDRGTPIVTYNNRYGSYDNVAGSLYVYIPMLMLVVPAIIKSLKEKKFSVLIAVLFFIVGVQTPFLYYALFGFTQAYSRWLLFFTISVLAFVALYLDKFKDEPAWTFDVGAATVLILAIVGGVLAMYISNEYNSAVVGKDLDYFTAKVEPGLAIGLMCGYIIILWFVIRLNLKKPHLTKILTGAIVLELALMGAFTIEGHGVANFENVNKGLDNNNSLAELVKATSKVDDGYYRSYSSLQSSDATNDGMRNNYNGTSFFHSIYNYNTDEFRDWTRLSAGSWSGVYNEKRLYMDTFLGTKYYYIQDDYLNYYQTSRKNTMHEDFTYNVPFGYVDISDSDEYNYPDDKLFKVYRNELAIEFGFSYDKIVDRQGNGVDPLGFEILSLDYGVFNTEDEDILDDVTPEPIAREIVEKYPDIEYVENPSYNASTFFKRIDFVSHRESWGNSVPLDTYGVTYYDIHSKKNAEGKTRNANSLGMDEVIALNFNKTYPNEYTYEAGAYPDFENNRDYSRYVAVIDFAVTPTIYNDYYNPNGMVFYLPSNFQEDNKVDIYLVTEDNKIITYDNHNDTNYSSNWTDKKWRAFYVHAQYGYNENGELITVSPAPKIKKMIAVSRSYELPRYTYFYVDNFDTYTSRIQKFVDNPITDVNYTTNKFTFKTNYEKNRFIVTQLPYEEGWTVEIKDSAGTVTEADLYISHGGFVSFVSGKGACTYTMTFYPPGLRIGSYLSAIGSFALLATMFSYVYVTINFRDYKLMSKYSYKRKED